MTSAVCTVFMLYLMSLTQPTSKTISMAPIFFVNLETRHAIERYMLISTEKTWIIFWRFMFERKNCNPKSLQKSAGLQNIKTTHFPAHIFEN